MDKNENCPICLNLIKESKISIYQCDHSLCQNCFNDLLLYHLNRCPLCLKEFIEYEVYSEDKIEKKSLTEEEIQRVILNKKTYESFLNG